MKNLITILFLFVNSYSVIPFSKTTTNARIFHDIYEITGNIDASGPDGLYTRPVQSPLPNSSINRVQNTLLATGGKMPLEWTVDYFFPWKDTLFLRFRILRAASGDTIIRDSIRFGMSRINSEPCLFFLVHPDTTRLIGKIVNDGYGAKDVVIFDSTTILTKNGFLFRGIHDSVQVPWNSQVAGRHIIKGGNYIFSYGGDSGIYRTDANSILSSTPSWTTKNNGLLYTKTIRISCMVTWKNMIFASVTSGLDTAKPQYGLYYSLNSGETWNVLNGDYNARQRISILYIDSAGLSNWHGLYVLGVDTTLSINPFMRYAVATLGHYFEQDLLPLTGVSNHIQPDLRIPNGANRIGMYSISGRRIKGNLIPKNGIYIMNGKIILK